MALPNSTFDQLSAITTKYYIPKMVDNIFASNALLYRWKRNSDVYTSVNGGTNIVQPLLYAAATSGGWYSGADTLNTTDNDVFTAAEYDWRQNGYTINISRIDELKNMGSKEQIVNFVSAKVQVTEASMKESFGIGLFNAGTTTDAIEGLRAMVDTTSPTTYGGISGTDNSWWRATKSTSTVLSMSLLQGGYGDVTIDGDMPTVAATTQNLFDKYFDILTPQQRYADSKTADGGFQNLLFRGIPVLVDSHCPASYWFFLNEKYIKFYYHPDENFRFEPFQRVINQNVATAKILWAGNLGSSNRRMNMVFTSLTE